MVILNKLVVVVVVVFASSKTGILPNCTILDKINGKPRPPLPSLPQIKDGKKAHFCPSRGFILDLGGDGGLLFHFILSKIVGEKKSSLITILFSF